MELPFPVNQLLFSNSIQDMGTQGVTVVVSDPDYQITYTTNDGKDCAYISSDGTNPFINIPHVFTEVSSFTFGFWIKFSNYGAWCVPITMNGDNVNISLGFGDSSMLTTVGDGVGSGSSLAQNSVADFTVWNHIALTYTNGVLKTYLNGGLASSNDWQQTFTVAQITVGGNNKYQFSMGGQISWSGYVRQLCVFDSSLSGEDIYNLYTITQENTVIYVPLKPTALLISSIATTSFTVTWSGGIGATSYNYTLDGFPVTPIDNGLTSRSATFTGLSVFTSYTLIITATNSESEASLLTNIVTLPNPPSALTVSTYSITYKSFVASWTGGEGATSYIYTLNGVSVIPSVEGTNSVTFTALSGTTAYTLVVRAVNIGGETSAAVTITTSAIPTIPLPTHQLILNDSSDDTGTIVSVPVTKGKVEYINYNGKDSLSVTSVGTNVPCITVPCVFTQASSFTISFWAYTGAYMNSFYSPVGLVNGVSSIIMFAHINSGTPSVMVYIGAPPESYVDMGAGPNYNGIPTNMIVGWNNFTMTYSAGTFTLYINGLSISSVEYDRPFTSTELNIGQNGKYTGWNFGQPDGTMYIRQVCTFDTVLSADQISVLYDITQDNSLLTIPTDPLTPYRIRISNIYFTYFTASWLGGVGASEYTYTLNGISVSGTTDGNSATFTGLTPATSYSLVVTAVSGSVSKASLPEIAQTRPLLPLPSHQFVLNGITADVGTNPGVAIVTDPASVIEYTNYSGKDCIHINSDGTKPNIKIPYVVTDTSSFTIGFWANMPNQTAWEIPIVLGDGISPIILTAINGLSIYVVSGGTTISAGAATGITADWNHIGITYSNKVSSIYVNGNLAFVLPLTTFISTEINICGNSNYGRLTLGSSISNAYIRQLCIFDSLLNDDQVMQLYTQTEGGTVFTQPTPAVPYGILVSNIEFASFAVSWSGGIGATSYSYTLNGSTVTPIDNGVSSKFAIFTGLSSYTTYSLVITAVGGYSSSPVSITTRKPLPLPLNQFVFSNSSNDVGTDPLGATVQGVTYTTYDGKDCVYIETDSVNSAIRIPYVVKNTDAFTIAFWLHVPFTDNWNLPLGLDDGESSIIEVSTANTTIRSFIGDETGSVEGSIEQNNWNHVVISYQNNKYITYINNTLILNSTLIKEFTSTKINIGGNNSYIGWNVGPQTSCIAYIRQLCTFDSVLSADQVDQLYTQTEGNTVLAPPLDPLTPYKLQVIVDYTSFTVSWLGTTGATSYTYTLNGIPVTPTQTNNSAIFTDLTSSTSYTLVITALTATTSKSSRAKVIITRTPLPLPINQLVFDGESTDIGSASSTVTVTGLSNISYTNNYGKDSIHIVSDGEIPRVNIPCVFTESSSFTFGFWIKFDTVGSWVSPITIHGPAINITLGFDIYSMQLTVANGSNILYGQNNFMLNSDFTQWTHVTVSYTNGTFKLYKNGKFKGNLSITQSFTTSQITVGGNWKYQGIGLGGQENWDGYLHQLCVFDSVLNTDQVLTLYLNTEDNTNLGIPPITQEEVTQIQNTFTTVTTVQGATAAIDAALASNAPPNAIVAAALANATPQMFTALVSNPAFIGTTVSVPATVAATLYASFADTTTLNTRLPLKVNFPAADGTVTPPTSGTNSKLAIDLTVNAYVPFRGCTGYGIHVIAGEQYFTTPSDALGTLVHVGDIITFTIDGGSTINSKVADLDIVLIPYTPPGVICFLGSAPVLTPNGYCRIDSLVVGDVVSTPSATAVIEKVEKQVYTPGLHTNPYVIPEGRFGSHDRILISPRHKVMAQGKMVEARFLGLEQEKYYEKITYYNIQVTNCENIIVAGLEVESLQALTRINIPIETFNYIIENKYGGKITDEMKECCHLMADGTISVPMLA